MKGWEQVLTCPRNALTKLGIMTALEYWLAEKALHGFKEFREAWEETRDAMLCEFVVSALKDEPIGSVRA